MWQFVLLVLLVAPFSKRNGQTFSTNAHSVESTLMAFLPQPISFVCRLVYCRIVWNDQFYFSYKLWARHAYTVQYVVVTCENVKKKSGSFAVRNIVFVYFVGRHQIIQFVWGFFFHFALSLILNIFIALRFHFVRWHLPYHDYEHIPVISSCLVKRQYFK